MLNLQGVFATSLGDLDDFCCCHMLTSIFCLMPWQRGLKSHWKNPWMMVAEDQIEVGPHGLPWIQITGRKICRERAHIPPNGKRRIIDSKVPAGRVYLSCKEGMHVICQVFYIFDGKKWAPDCLAALYQSQYHILTQRAAFDRNAKWSWNFRRSELCKIAESVMNTLDTRISNEKKIPEKMLL